MGGGGGLLQKFIEPRKVAIWSRTPDNLKRLYILWSNARFERETHQLYINEATKYERYYNRFIKPFKPHSDSSAPVVDYKRQMARGTFVEGSDSYVSEPASQKRLLNFTKVYTEEERAEREKYKTYDIAKGALIICGLFFIWDYKQSRPIVWCERPYVPPWTPFRIKKPYGGHDVRSVRRGFEVFRQVCNSCHTVHRRYDDLVGTIYPRSRVEDIAREHTRAFWDRDTNLIGERQLQYYDYMNRPYSTFNIAGEANGGKLPPDLTGGTMMFPNGMDYIFWLLLGYRDPPYGLELGPGQYFNVHFHGGVIGMPPPLEPGLVDYEDGTPATVPQMAHDVVSYLTWMCEPNSDQRKIATAKLLGLLIVGMICCRYTARWTLAEFYTRRTYFGKLKYV